MIPAVKLTMGQVQALNLKHNTQWIILGISYNYNNNIIMILYVYYHDSLFSHNIIEHMGLL